MPELFESGKAYTFRYDNFSESKRLCIELSTFESGVEIAKRDIIHNLFGSFPFILL